MKRRCLEAAINLTRHIQKNISGQAYFAAWGQASGLEEMLICELDRKKRKKDTKRGRT